MTAYRDIAAMNWSSLSAMATSPLLYHWRTEHPRPDSAAMRLGRAIHCAVLEPAKFEARYASYAGTRRGKAWEAWRDSHPDVESLTAAERTIVEMCAERVRGHTEAAKLLSGGRAEETIVWTDEPTGTKCKGRLDYITPAYFVDLKTTRDLGKFERADAASYLYHGQSAWYRDGGIAACALSADAESYIVAVETSEPHDVAVFRVAGMALAAGQCLCRELPIRDLELPSWAAGMSEAQGRVYL
jgi:hypothetical protein